jgi:hypothetical protein
MDKVVKQEQQRMLEREKSLKEHALKRNEAL